MTNIAIALNILMQFLQNAQQIQTLIANAQAANRDLTADELNTLFMQKDSAAASATADVNAMPNDSVQAPASPVINPVAPAASNGDVSNAAAMALAQLAAKKAMT